MALKLPGGPVSTPAPAATSETTAQAYAKHLQAQPAKAVVSVEKKVAGVPWSGPVGESETVVPGLYTSNGMSVTVEGSQTLNMGDFNSARIGVSLTVPCSPDTLNEAYDWALNWCSERIQAEVKSAKGI